MKNLKKNIMIFGAVVIAILLVSVVTVVGQVQSKPVMDEIQKNESLFSLFQELENSMGINNQNLDINSQQEIEQFLQNINSSELLNYLQNLDISDIITSDEFINFMNSPEIYDFITSNEFSTLYNTNAVQNFISSELFIDFFNSDACQYFLDHLNIGNGGTQLNSQNSNTVLQSQPNTMTVNKQQVLQTLQTTITGRSTQSMPTSSQQIAPAAQMQGQINMIIGDGTLLLIFLAFTGFIIGFIFGIILWIPAAILILLVGTPYIAIFIWVMIYASLGTIWIPGEVTAIFFLTVLVGIGTIILFPVISGIFIAYWLVVYL